MIHYFSVKGKRVISNVVITNALVRAEQVPPLRHKANFPTRQLTVSFNDAMRKLLAEVKRIENKSIPLNKDIDLTDKHAWNASSWARDHVTLAEPLPSEWRERFWSAVTIKTEIARLISAWQVSNSRSKLARRLKRDLGRWPSYRELVEANGEMITKTAYRYALTGDKKLPHVARAQFDYCNASQACRKPIYLVKNYKRGKKTRTRLIVRYENVVVGPWRYNLEFDLTWLLSRLLKAKHKLCRVDRITSELKLIDNETKISKPIFVQTDDGSFKIKVALFEHKPVRPSPTTMIGVDLGVNENNLVAATLVSMDGEPLKKFTLSDKADSEIKTAIAFTNKLYKVSVKRKKLKSVVDSNFYQELVVECKKAYENRSHANKRVDELAASELVNFAVDNNSMITLENLRAVRNNLSPDHYGFRYASLTDKIKHKADRCGIKVILVDPAYTSYTCSACGNTVGNVLNDERMFICSVCGHEEDRDYNASKIIARRGLARLEDTED